MKTGTYRTDENGVILTVNTDFKRMLGYPERTVFQGKNLGELPIFKRYPRHDIKSAVRHFHQIQGIPVMLLSKDGQEISFIEDVRMIMDTGQQDVVYESRFRYNPGACDVILPDDAGDIRDPWGTVPREYRSTQ
ncbi:MAG: PAS domain-containing protein [Candidatus Marinimicrobia bacterium]|nr:PAS domain-containing protein [Candidatus Neomarinimicrobiota bacterium]MCF7829579.1 PAS domain-containing protein [Candidatus Neomarinimicrobiota bacterium]MCF7882233.1 PAS domain-containing protein [Candidatus Neomarinimicrobiota bacterium]